MRNRERFSFWKRIRFKYKISVFNENTLEEIWGLRLSKLSVFLYLFLFSLFLIIITSAIIIKTPIHNYLPGYLNSELRENIIHNALMLDSLEQVAANQTNYLNNMGAILRGNIEIDSIRSVDSLVWLALDSIGKSERESLFVKNFEEEERYNLSTLPPVLSADELLLFFTKPVNGEVDTTVVKKSNGDNVYGIDIAVIKDQPVVASQQGTIVYAGYDVTGKYVALVQHELGFATLYEQMDMLLKGVGDKVETGESIGMIRGVSEKRPGVFHFELWQNGEQRNPVDYVVF